MASGVDDGNVKVVELWPNSDTDVGGAPAVVCAGLEGELKLEESVVGGKELVQERVYDIAQLIVAGEPHGRKLGAGEAVGTLIVGIFV